MSRTTQALITHKVLRWARERRNITEADVAKRLGTSPDRVRSWETETSDKHPTLRQAQNIAGVLNIPLGYLFLSTPPSLTADLPDLRTVSGEPIQNPSPEFIDQLYDVLRKLEWFSEYRESQEVEPVAFIGRFSLDTPLGIIAEDIRSVIGIDDEMRRRAGSWEAFLTAFVRRAEAAGVLVFRSGVVSGNTHRPLSVEEFRGFAITDEFAPAIFINSKDYKVAQTFTIAHELAHLWIGQSGVSNLNYALLPEQQVNHIDRFCDKIAAEVLVPESDFLNRWDISTETHGNVQALSRHYRVSRFVILRRAFEAELVAQSEFDALYNNYRDDYHEPSGDGGDFYNLFFARNSMTLTFSLLTATAEGHISRLDTARLLNIRVQTIERAQRELFGVGSS